MDGIENVFQELFRKTVFASHLDDLVEDGVPSDSLDDSYVIIPLIFTDPAADLHSGTERIQDVLVDDVDLCTELVDVLLPLPGLRIGIPYGYLVIQQVSELRWCKLLLRIAECN